MYSEPNPTTHDFRPAVDADECVYTGDGVYCGETQTAHIPPVEVQP